MVAAKRFDPTKGFKFISYAVRWIKQSIIKAIIDTSRIVRLPSNKVGNLKKMNEAKSSLLQELEYEPNAEKLSAELDMPVSEIDFLQSSYNRHLSVDAPIKDKR